jgi:hypothetical protein
MSNALPSPTAPAGYEALVNKYHLKAIRHWHRSAVGSTSARHTRTDPGQVYDVYPSPQRPEDTLGGRLEFALKYDGVNLAILAALFEQVSPDELVAYIQSKPTGKYARRLWFFYEWLTGRRLPLEDVTTGNYVDALENDLYYTAAPVQVRRQRVNDNLLGDVRFCPIVRRTEKLRAFDLVDLPKKCKSTLADYPPALLKRALSYLYTKETKSSFEIESVALDATRTERFAALLQVAEKEDFFDKPHLLDLQHRIVDERFRDLDYRQRQNYVGETVAWHQQRVHFISPKPGDLPELMDGMYAAHHRLGAGGVGDQGKALAVVHAAVIAFGFVFMHPFEDGNGRIHRFLIHNILARRGFTPQGMIFPVSAAMLQDRAAYDAALEAYSTDLIPLVEFDLDDQGQMTVHNSTAGFYRYIDLTPQTEALYGFIQRVIEVDLVEELKFLWNYDETKQAIQAIVDMPDRLIDLFIRLCLQNGNVLSATKRRSLFERLTDDEIHRMEAAVQEGYR